MKTYNARRIDSDNSDNSDVITLTIFIRLMELAAANTLIILLKPKLFDGYNKFKTLEPYDHSNPTPTVHPPKPYRPPTPFPVSAQSPSVPVAANLSSL